jgi:hypothetical protein
MEKVNKTGGYKKRNWIVAAIVRAAGKLLASGRSGRNATLSCAALNR